MSCIESRLLPAAVFLAAAAGGCRSWDESRRDFIDPFNEFLHHQYPRAHRGGIDELLALYRTELLSDRRFRDAKAALLGRFARVDRAYAVIERIELLDGERRVRAPVTLSLHGVTPEGGRLSMVREEVLTCERLPQGWRIAAEDLMGETSQGTSGPPQFSEEAEARGLSFKHASVGVKDRWGGIQNYTPGSGIAAGDYDGDGFEDIFLAGGKELRLFRNLGDGTFADATAAAGIASSPQGEGRCAAFADFDNDGAVDLFVGVLDGPDLLYRNEGNGVFRDVAAAAGLEPSGETTSACFADFNRDGWLDLYVVNGGNLLRRDPEPIYNALNATPNRLFISNRNGTFSDRTEKAGVGHGGWALCGSVQDFDLDGDADIFIGNDFGFDVLFRNRGDATFEEVSIPAGIDKRGASMSASWGDYDGDGAPDLFVAGMASNSRWILDHPAFPAPAPWAVNLLFRGRVLHIFSEMLHGNRLYRNRGDGTFAEMSEAAGIRNNGWAWSSIFLDYDNDSWLDIYGVNGMISGESPKDL